MAYFLGFLFIMGALLAVYLCFHLREEKHSARRRQEQRRKHEQMALAMSPAWQQKIAADRKYEIDLGNLALKWQEFSHKRYMELHRPHAETYSINEEIATITPFHSLKQPLKPTPLEDVIPRDETVLKSFAELVADGTIPRSLKEGKLVLGYMLNELTQAWELRFGSWLDLYSCAVAGVSGSGKTTTVLFLLLQAILAGAKLMIIDPHLADPEESLAARLEPFRELMILPACDDTQGEILKRARVLTKELARRKKLGLKYPDVERIVFVIDEFNSIMQKGGEVADELQALLTAIEQEGRKCGIFAMLVGQNWSKNSIGDAVVRQCLASSLVHRMGDIDQAKKLLPLPQYAKATIQLAQGYWVFRDTYGGFNKMYTPLTDESDAARLLFYVPLRRPGKATSKATTVDAESHYVDAESHYQEGARSDVGSGLVVTDSLPTMGTTQADLGALSAQEKRILKKYRAGDSVSKIITEEFTNSKGEPLKGGTAFTEKTREIQALISRFIPAECEA